MSDSERRPETLFPVIYIFVLLKGSFSKCTGNVQSFKIVFIS